MELKTLKDFEIPDVAVEGVIGGIRREAIKYVKELRRKTGTTGEIDYRLSFKHFFNLTEEDFA